MSIGALGLTMAEIQQIITTASENTPETGPDGDEMGDPEYVTAYLLNIVIPLIQYNNLRIEEQLAAIGIRIPTKEQIQEAIAAQHVEQGRLMQMQATPEDAFAAEELGDAEDADDAPH